MAHKEQSLFFQSVREVYPEHFSWVNVIEIGSLDINGSLRGLFSYPNYVGVDLELGPGVDYAVLGENVKYRDDSFDISVSAECFEHNPQWAEGFANMKRMTRPGGLIVFSCAGTGRPEHGTARTDPGSSPFTTSAGWNYYRNLTPQDFEGVPGLLDGLEYKFFEYEKTNDLYFVGMKHDFLKDIKAFWE